MYFIRISIILWELLIGYGILEQIFQEIKSLKLKFTEYGIVITLKMNGILDTQTTDPHSQKNTVITSLFQVALNDTLLNIALTLIAAESCRTSIFYNLEMRKLKIKPSGTSTFTVTYTKYLRNERKQPYQPPTKRLGTRFLN